MTNAFGIYVHIPFCVHKCSYCDFYSFTQYGEQDFEKYVNALKEEIQRTIDWFGLNDRVLPPAKSVFLGGGTPSLLSLKYLKKIFKEIEDHFILDPDIEITIEANPETIHTDKVRQWLSDTPINRISLGAQSFNSRYLSSLERLGSAESIEQASEILLDAGCKNFNLDLIMAIPGQSESEIEDDIRRAIALGPSHLSNYQLSLKPGHPLFTKLPDGDRAADLYEVARGAIERGGFEQYEISNFARKGFECFHNLLYWSGGDFLGLGPSAASRFFWDGVFHHRKQVAIFSKYLEQKSFEESPWQVSSKRQTQMEALFLEIRKNSGIHQEKFLSRYDFDFKNCKKLELLRNEGLLELTDTALILTDKGRLLADSIVCQLIDQRT